MPILADYHLHSSYSGDSTEPMENMVKAAIAKGLTNICFTEHVDIDYPVYDDCPAGYFDLAVDPYLYELATLKGKYQDRITVSFGIELGMQPHLQKEMALLVRSHEFDFIIGSTHVANRKDPYYPSFFEGRSEEEAFREYLTAEVMNIRKFKNFDVCGHMDYVVRYGKSKDAGFCYEKYSDLFDELLEMLIENEKGLELNTGALRAGMKGCHPCIDVLKRYREMGGDIITVGSDAHKAEDLGAGLDTAAQILTDCGFKYYCIFENRVPEYKKL